MAYSITSGEQEYPLIRQTETQDTADCAQRMLEEAKRLGATDAEVQVSRARGLSVNVRLGEVDTLEFHDSRQLTLVVYQGQQKGVATTTDDSIDAIKRSAAAALAIAREAEADVCAGLADADQLARDNPDLDRYHPWELTPEAAIAEARECEAAGRALNGIVNSDGAGVSAGVGLSWYANSRGFSQGNTSSSHHRNCVLIAEDDNGMQRDHWYDVQCQPKKLESAVAVGEKAAQRTLAKLGGSKPETGSYPVLFAPEVASSILGHFISAISGGRLYRKNSFLCDALGQSIFPSWVTIGETPRLPRQLGSASFDGDGLATRRQDFIKDGELAQYVLSLYAARQLGMSPTGNGSGVHNLFVSHTGHTQADLLAEMQDGIMVTDLMGQAINPVTGDYSRGAAGFRVEGGKLSGPLEEFTLAGNLRDMFAALRASGTDVDYRSRIHTGSLLIDGLKVAG